MIKVVLVDDHKIIRQGISAILETSENICVSGSFDTGANAVNWLEENKADIVLMDISLHEENGIYVTKDITSKYPKTKVIMLTMHNESIFLTKSIEAGASGYILKETSATEFLNAISIVHKGNYYYDDKIISSTYVDFNKNQTSTASVLLGQHGMPCKLSEREVEILKFVIKGLKNGEISYNLNISRRTVDAHRRNILQKTGTKNPTEMI